VARWRIELSQPLFDPRHWALIIPSLWDLDDVRSTPTQKTSSQSIAVCAVTVDEEQLSANKDRVRRDKNTSGS